MARTRLRSDTVKVKPDDIPHMVAAVRAKGARALGLSDRAFDYWVAGDLPKALLILLDHPDVAAALYRDAERLALKAKIDAE